MSKIYFKNFIYTDTFISINRYVHISKLIKYMLHHTFKDKSVCWWILKTIKWLEKKLDGSYTRMLWAILNKSWWQHPTKHQLYGHLLPITKTIQIRRTRHAGHCWRSRDELISDVLLWNPTYGWAKAGWPARTYIHTYSNYVRIGMWPWRPARGDER